MFFCPNCNNSFDIAKISLAKTQDKKEKQEHKQQELKHQELKHQEGGDSKDKQHIEDLITKILRKEQISELDVKDVPVESVTSNPVYKKLKEKDKEIVYNAVLDVKPKDLKPKDKEVESSSIANFICKNCGFIKKIEPRTKIFSRTSDDISQTFGTTNYEAMLHSKILPITRHYNCPNTKCESHKDTTKKEAVFFRLNNMYKTKYICRACKTAFS